MILKDDVQILRARDQTNTSLILVAFGRRLGQLHILAKGARRFSKKGFEGGFDILTRGELLAFPRPGEGLWIFKEWDERARPKLGQSYRMLAAASYLCEFIEVLTRPLAQAGGGVELDETETELSRSSAQLFDLLGRSAALLEKKLAHPGLLLLSFTLRALAVEGLLPPLDGCEACAKKFPAQLPRGFAARLGPHGFACAACTRAQAASGVPQRTVLLGAEALRVLAFCARSIAPVQPGQARYSSRTGMQLSLALEFLVHGALEQNLRTLDYAKKLLSQSSQRTQKK